MNQYPDYSKKLIVVFALLLWNALICIGDCRVLHLLPGNADRLFPVLYADPYETQLGFSADINHDQYIGRIGGSVYLFQLCMGKNITETDKRGIFLGITGYSWSLLNREGHKFPLIAVDYLIASFVDFHWHKSLWRVKFSHISAHLGDRYFTLNKVVVPGVYSREFFSIYTAYPIKNIIIYQTIHCIYHSIPVAKSIKLQDGFIINLNKISNHLIPYINVDFQMPGEYKYQSNFSFQLGIRMNYKKNTSYRLAVSFYKGNNIFGQYCRQRQHIPATGFYIDF